MVERQASHYLMRSHKIAIGFISTSVIDRPIRLYDDASISLRGPTGSRRHLRSSSMRSAATRRFLYFLPMPKARARCHIFARAFSWAQS